ncbi:unnamed protein product [Closterium sp. NIES-53]
MNQKKLRQIDVANAFLYAPIDAEIFVELPHESNADPNQVCQFEKSLYGIKQAPRLWQQHLHARLIRIGFLQLPHDQGMYRLTKGTDYILLIVYVDDLLYIGSTDAITTCIEVSTRNGADYSKGTHESTKAIAGGYAKVKAIFDLDFDAILAAMYALSISAEGDCYVCVPPDPGIEAAALGARESAAPGASESAALGAGESALSDRTTLTPLSRPVAVSLADPSGGPVLARYSTVLRCPAAPSGSLSGLYLPSFSTNLVSGPESAPCSCCLLSHQTLLWHHRLGQPSLPRLRGMASHVLVSGLPQSLPPLPPGPAPTCVPCVEGQQRATPHSSEFPPTEAPLQTLHMDVWGPARVRGQGHERYFLLVVDDYSRYTTVFPLRSKGEVTEVLIDWIRVALLQLRERFGSDFPVLRLHSVRGGEFSSDLLRAFCRAEGIRQTFTLPASPQQNGIAERRTGMVMDVARTSMIHAAAPHFLWPFAVQYAAHQINLQPRVSLPETSPTLRWTGKVGDASAFRVWGSRDFVRDLSADKLSSCAVPCVFLGFPPDAPGWQFYHPTSRRVLSSQDLTFDESVPYYRLFPYRTAPLPPPPLFLAPGPSSVDPLPPQGPAPSVVSQVDAVKLVEVAVDSGASGGAEPERAEPGRAGYGGAEPEHAESGGAASAGAEPERAETRGAELGVAESGGAEPAGAGPGGPSGALSRRELPSPQELREWFARRWSHAARAGGAADAGGSAAAGGTGAGGVAGAGAGGSTSAGGAGATGPGGARIGGTGAAGPGGARGGGATGGAGAGAAGGTGAGGAAGVGADAGGAGIVLAGSGGASRPRPYFVSLLEQVLGLPPSSSPAPSLECPPPVQAESQLQLASPLPAPSPYAGPSGGLAERREPESRPASPVRTARTSCRVPRQRPPVVPGTHQMALRPSTAPQRVPLPSPPQSSLRAASPTVTRLLATAVTDPSFESADASALVAEEFQCFAAALPHLVSLLLALEGDPDAPDIQTPRSYAEAIEGTYVDEVPPPAANIVSGMRIFRVKRPTGSPPVFKARYVARGFSQRQGVDCFQTFSPTPKMTTLRVVLHVTAQRDYELHSLDFSSAFLQGSLHEEIWLRRPPGFTGSFPPGTQWSLQRPVYGLRQAPREWHDTLRTTLAALGFAPSTADPLLFLRTDTSLPPFYILVYIDDLVFATADTSGLAHVLLRFDITYSSPQATPLSTRHSLSALPSDESVEPSGPLSGLGLVLGGRSPVVLTGHADASWVDNLATQRSSQGYTFSLEPPRSPPVLYVDNKAMLALCREHKLEHRTKHIALRYFLARELQQRGQLRLVVSYVASQANTADIFTKALQPCDHQRFCTMLACFALLCLTGRGGGGGFGGGDGGGGGGGVGGGRGGDGGGGDGEGRGNGATSITAVGASRGDPRTPFFEGCSPVPLLPSVASAAAVDLIGTEWISAASAPSERRRISKAKRGKGAGRGSGGGGSGGAGGGWGGGGGGGRGGGFGGGGGAGGSGGRPQQQQRSREIPSPQQLREWYAGRQGSGGTGPYTYVLRTGDRIGEQCGGLHAIQRCFGCLTDAWCAQFPDATEIPRWHDLLRSGVAIFDLDFDAILAAMYAMSISAEGDCYVGVPPDPGIEAAALGASESAAPGARESATLGAVSQRVPLPSPPASSLPALADPESDSLRAASPTVTRVLATVVTDPSIESIAASALVTELVDFAARCRLDFATSLVAESASVCPPSVGGECALSTDVLEDRQEEFQCFAAA